VAAEAAAVAEVFLEEDVLVDHHSVEVHVVDLVDITTIAIQYI
jgi:hypothetical protein